MHKRPILRAVADRDVRAAVQYYKHEVSVDIAPDFASVVLDHLAKIADHPGIGSPRYTHELDLPGLRSTRLKRFPYLVLYFERDDHIDVWRVLHAKRHIPAWMTDN